MDHQQTFIMVASSSDRNQIKSRDPDKRTSPLIGVKYDLQMFKRKFYEKDPEYIMSSRQCKTLLPKQFFVNWLRNKFETAPKDVYLFYSGHGHENGDWAIQTAQKPNGDTFSLEELLTIWKESELAPRGHLFIIMDSCHSGNWCYRLKDRHVEMERISVLASCSPGQKSKDFQGGGLLNRCVFGLDPDQAQEDISLLFHPSMKQTPVYLHNTKEPAFLTQNNLKILHQDIRNIHQIGSEIESNKQNTRNGMGVKKIDLNSFLDKYLDKPQPEIEQNQQQLFKLRPQFRSSQQYEQFLRKIISKQFEKRGFSLQAKLTQPILQNLINRISLDNAGVREFDREIFSEIWAETCLRNENTIVVSKFIQKIVQAQGILRSRMQDLSDKLRKIDRTKNKKQADQTEQDLKQFTMDYRIITSAFIKLPNKNMQTEINKAESAPWREQKIKQFIKKKQINATTAQILNFNQHNGRMNEISEWTDQSSQF